MRASCLAFCSWRSRGLSREERNDRVASFAGKRPATASGCGGAGPSAALPLLPDAQWHRLRRGALHPAPRRSQRRSTPFFSSLLDAPLKNILYLHGFASSPKGRKIALLRERLEPEGLRVI